jgi:protein gp37
MGKTTIEWADESWNPIVGCTEISPGCANCYAARLAATRLKNTPQYKGLARNLKSEIQFDAVYPHGIPVGKIQPRWTGEVRNVFALDPKVLEEPVHCRKPRRIFVCDMGDLFHESVDVEWIAKVWIVMRDCPQHTFQVLTKRPQRVLDLFGHDSPYSKNPLQNVWLGVSVENQHFADERIPLLLKTPAAVRWISAEPLLGPVNLQCVKGGENFIDAISGIRSIRPCLDWVVCGGESGPNARPMHPDWARSIRDRCHVAGVPFFFKQWGEWLPIRRSLCDMPSEETGYRVMNALGRAWVAGAHQEQHTDPWLFQRVGKKKAGRLLDGREWNEFPHQEPAP